MAVFVAWKNGYGHAGAGFKLSNADKLKAFRDAILALALPFLVLGGIYSGWFTPTEAAAVAVAYSLVVSLVIYREIKISLTLGSHALVGEDLGDGHVHHRQRHPLHLRPGQRTDPRIDLGDDHQLGPAALAVPHPRQYPLCCSWAV